LLLPNVLALCLVSFCVSFCFYFYITFLPKYLKDQFHVDYAQSQFITGLPLLLGGFACLAGGFLSDYAIRKTASKRWGRSLIPIVGWTAAGLCAFAVSQLDSAVAVMALIVIAFAFQDLGVPSMWSLPTDIESRFAGTLGGWMNSAGAIGFLEQPAPIINRPCESTFAIAEYSDSRSVSGSPSQFNGMNGPNCRLRALFPAPPPKCLPLCRTLRASPTLKIKVE